MVIDGILSEEFVEGFAEFIKTQDKTAQKKYINNFLTFIDETKGLRKLSEEEKSMVKRLGA